MFIDGIKENNSLVIEIHTEKNITNLTVITIPTPKWAISKSRKFILAVPAPGDYLVNFNNEKYLANAVWLNPENARLVQWKQVAITTADTKGFHC